ncbi:MAG: hypothetical protein H8E41_10805 [Desulfobulbaceae bacterium]|uniref:Uncharacterized protein n=1 Tax=Candidatus Desulfobia pelagia TaxID=2841692 RepID=A0A8J6NH23_9BACT|nr:hypothetical protein [Candidatus Desulfobia pelagia]
MQNKHRMALAVMGLIFIFIVSGGCSLLPPKESDPVVSGLQELDAYAWDCFGRGRDYMQEGRYELAKQQFSFAAASAVSETLYEDAVDGIRRVDRIIMERR